MSKEYLGDSVYAKSECCEVVLTTGVYGGPPSNEIVLGQHELLALVKFAIKEGLCEDFYKEGLKTGVQMYAWWKDGEQQVGSCGTTLKKALEDIDEKPTGEY